jgi:hypothetical protein
LCDVIVLMGLLLADGLIMCSLVDDLWVKAMKKMMESIPYLLIVMLMIVTHLIILSLFLVLLSLMAMI